MMRDHLDDMMSAVPADFSWLLDDRQRSDNALATRFIDLYGDGLRYVPKWGQWLAWDEQRWRIDTGGLLATMAGRTFASELWSEFMTLARSNSASRDAVESAMRVVRSANKASGIRSFLSLAKADNRVIAPHDSLNLNVNLLNLPNGTYELSSGKFREHRKEDLLTQIAGVPFDPDADCPKWRDAMSLICGGDPGLARYVQQLLGYSLSGTAGEHVLPIIFGTGCNGKSFVWNTFAELLGDYASIANDGLLLGDREGHPTEKAALYQKRFVAISEPEEGSRLRESRVKELTGDSFVTARRMREDFWTFRRTHTFWLSTNHFPRVSGTDEGIWRRLKIIPFAVDLRTKVKPIPDYHRALVTEEGPGILNWLLGGYVDYIENGFQEPAAVRRLSQEHRVGQDHLGQFLADCCTVAPEAKVQAAVLFGAYQQWGGQWSNKAFGDAMTARFVKDKTDFEGKRNCNVYIGIGLNLGGL